MPAAFIIAIALAAQLASEQTAEQKAVEYLSGEVPRWSRENHCFSCHNNGDGARALYAAAQRGYTVSTAALADTMQWLLQPGNWDNNRGDPGFSDKKLARIQFAAALVEAYSAGLIRDKRALIEAAQSLIPYQEADGSWLVDVGAIGSPATYGTALATYMARRTLEKADDARFKKAIVKANQWFIATKPRSLLDAAAALLALPGAGPVKQRSLDFILSAQSSDGGWGPHPLTPAEPFDTAVVLIALRELNEPERTSGPIARGRAFLVARQQPGGGWTETTRPPGGQSYAQHISTSGWAALALIRTR
jgi:squalene cyclase